MSEFRQSVLRIAEACARKHVTDVILSPGSRSAPLALAFLRHPNIRCRTIVDERAAGFVALGIAQQTGKPVALVCTSGTAALNFAPAVAEAFYQQAPLLLLTADRPPEWIGQDDGQTIVQRNLYEPHCRASYELPVDDTHSDARWHFDRILSEALNRTLWPVPGPVHVNVPLREPLYPRAEFDYPRQARHVDLIPSEPDLPASGWKDLLDIWEQAEKKLIVAGLFHDGHKLKASLRQLQDDSDAVVLADITSNCDEVQPCQLFDMILGTDSSAIKEELRPDLLLSFGGPVVSKNLKLYLREFKPRRHWHIRMNAPWPDPFQTTTTIVPMRPAAFFDTFLKKLKRAVPSNSIGYTEIWLRRERQARRALSEFLGGAPHCELSAMALVLKELPPGAVLQLGNSSSVRLASLVSLGENRDVAVYSNRGVCGIDGTVSAAVGAALAGERLTTLITGDLAFFYDRNGLWHSHLPDNLRIVVFNNHGGGIFRLLDGCRDLPELESHFAVAHGLTAERVAADHGLSYARCDSSEALAAALPVFFRGAAGPAILEVDFDPGSNSELFLKFKRMLEELR